jgi:predicted PurR-regulated permease PerM
MKQTAERTEVKEAETPRRRVPAGMTLLVVGATATILFVGIYQIRDIFAPAFFALTLVVTVRPIHRWLIKKGVPPWVAATFTLITLAIMLVGIVGLMAWSLVGLPDIVKSYAGDFQGWIDQIMSFLEDRGFATDQITDEIMSKLNVGQAVSTVLNAASSVSSVGGLLFVIALALLFITVDTMTMHSRASIIKSHDLMLYEALASFEGRVRQYWIVSTVFGMIVAVVNGIVLQFLNVPMPVAWALFSFITNYIPNIGFIIGVIPPAIMGALSNDWTTGVWVIVAYSVINAVIQGVFQPKITGDAVGLSTTVTFLSLLFWTVVIGPFGAILAVPLTLFTKALLVDSSAQTRWIAAFLIPEGDAENKRKLGYFDSGSSVPDEFAEPDTMQADQGKRIRNTLRSLALRPPTIHGEPAISHESEDVPHTHDDSTNDRKA